MLAISPQVSDTIRMGDQRPRPEADRILVAQLTGEARHRARWRPLTEEEEAAALAELRALAGGRADLLAQVAGIFEGTSEGELGRAAGPVRRAAVPPGRGRHRRHTGLDRGGPPPLGERQAAAVLRLGPADLGQGQGWSAAGPGAARLRTGARRCSCCRCRRRTPTGRCPRRPEPPEPPPWPPEGRPLPWPPPEPFREARLTLAEAFRSEGPTSSTSTSYTVRFSPSLVSYDRCRSRPWTITRIPRVSDSATFSAACRHTLQVRNRLSPSFHSPVELSLNRGVDATRNFATGCPDGVNRSSGSSTRLPAIVIWVSPAAICLLSVITLALFVSALILHRTTDISGRIGAGDVASGKWCSVPTAPSCC